MKKLKLSTIGLLQALGAAAYCALISGFFWSSRNFQTPPQFIISLFMLFLLVFSVAVVGSIVFGYVAYLAVAKQKTKEALSVLAYTLLYSLIIILVIAIIIVLM